MNTQAGRGPDALGVDSNLARLQIFIADTIQFANIQVVPQHCVCVEQIDHLFQSNHLLPGEAGTIRADSANYCFDPFVPI